MLHLSRVASLGTSTYMEADQQYFLSLKETNSGTTSPFFLTSLLRWIYPEVLGTSDQAIMTKR